MKEYTLVVSSKTLYHTTVKCVNREEAVKKLTEFARQANSVLPPLMNIFANEDILEEYVEEV